MEPFVLRLSDRTTTGTLGSRQAAFRDRKTFEDTVLKGGKVILDFSGISLATQSYIDELVGVFILHEGEVIVKSFQFLNCNDELKAIIRFVISDNVFRRKSNFGGIPKLDSKSAVTLE